MSENIPTLLCAKFQSSLYIEFNNVNVGSIVKKDFRIENPHDSKTIRLVVEKCPENKGFQVYLNSSGHIPPKGKITGQVVWTPDRDMAAREIVILKSDNKFSLQLTLHGVAGLGNDVLVHENTTPMESLLRRKELMSQSRGKIKSAKILCKALNQTKNVNRSNLSKRLSSSLTYKSSINIQPIIEWMNSTISSHITIDPSDKFIGYVAFNDRGAAAHILDYFDIAHLPRVLTHEIDNGKLSLRHDQCVHLDVGLQKALLDILFSYELPWLCLGVEAILMDETCATASVTAESSTRLTTEQQQQLRDRIISCINNPIKQASLLKSLLIEHMVAPASILERFVCHRPLNVHMESKMRTELRKHTLKKFLSLVMFLDIARLNQALKLQRLFKKGATVSSSDEVLNAFNRLCVRGEGDLIQRLAALGYKVAFQQTYADDFDFTVSNVNTDLKDGLRLGKLVELLLIERGVNGVRSGTLIQQLRIPAISRLQKIHNVSLSLQALYEIDPSFFGPLEQPSGCDRSCVSVGSSSNSSSVNTVEHFIEKESRRLVEGNLEATHLLLWRLIYSAGSRRLQNTDGIVAEIRRIERTRRYVVRNKYEIGLPNISDSKNDISKLLLSWLNSILCQFRLDLVTDLSTCLANGVALCTLLHYYHPTLITMRSILCIEEQQKAAISFVNSCEKHQRNFITLRRACKSLGGVPLPAIAYSASSPPDEGTMTFFLTFLFSRLMHTSVITQAAIKIQRICRKKFYHLFLAKKKSLGIKRKLRASTVNILPPVRDFPVCVTASMTYYAHVILGAFIRNMYRTKRLRVQAALSLDRERKLETITLMSNKQLQAEAIVELQYRAVDPVLTVQQVPVTFVEPIDRRNPLVHSTLAPLAIAIDQVSNRTPSGPLLTPHSSSRLVLKDRDLNLCLNRSSTGPFDNVHIPLELNSNCSPIVPNSVSKSMIKQVFQKDQSDRNQKLCSPLDNLLDLSVAKTRIVQTAGKSLRDMLGSPLQLQLTRKCTPPIEKENTPLQVFASCNIQPAVLMTVRDNIASNLSPISPIQLNLNKSLINQRSSISYSPNSQNSSVTRPTRESMMMESMKVQFENETSRVSEEMRMEREARQYAEHLVIEERARRAALEERVRMMEDEHMHAELLASQAREERLQKERYVENCKRCVHEFVRRYVKISQRNRAIRRIRKMQATCRAFVAQRRFTRLRLVVSLLQALWRRKLYAYCMKRMNAAASLIQFKWCQHRERTQFLSMRSAACVMQAWARMKTQQKLYTALRCSAVVTQKFTRMWLCRKAFKKSVNSVILVQSIVRRSLARLHYQNLVFSRAIIKRFLSRVTTALRLRQQFVIAKNIRSQRRLRLLRAAAVLSRFVAIWIRRTYVVMTARKIRRWYFAYLPLLRARKIRTGVTRLQALFRSVSVRMIQPALIVSMRQRVRLAEARVSDDPGLQLKNRVAQALIICGAINAHSITAILQSCTVLCVSTEYSLSICMSLLDSSVMINLLSVLKSCSRSLPHQQVLSESLCVFLNISRHEPLCKSLAEQTDCLETVVDLLQMFRDIRAVFCLAAELFCRLVDSSDQVKAKLHGSMRDHMRRLEGIRHILERKHRLEARVRVFSTAGMSEAVDSMLPELKLALSDKVYALPWCERLRYVDKSPALMYIRAIVDLIDVPENLSIIL